MPNLTVLHIFSASYSGSTWLNLLLGSHPEAFSIGEVKTILKLGSPACTVHGDACAVWPRFRAEKPGGFYEQLSELTGKRIFVVNNSRKWVEHEHAPGVRCKYIHLVRDGRAVVASRRRKKAEGSFLGSCRVWKREVRRNQRMLRRAGGGTVVRYEPLLESTPDELARLCERVGIGFDPGMTEYWRTDHCFLGGNRGTLYSMLRATGKHLPQDPESGIRTRNPDWDLEFYHRADISHFRDDRWQNEMTAMQRRVFSLVAGRLNRALGY